MTVVKLSYQLKLTNHNNGHTEKVSDPESLSFYVGFDTPTLNDRYLTL